MIDSSIVADPSTTVNVFPGADDDDGPTDGTRRRTHRDRRRVLPVGARRAAGRGRGDRPRARVLGAVRPRATPPAQPGGPGRRDLLVRPAGPAGQGATDRLAPHQGAGG